MQRMSLPEKCIGHSCSLSEKSPPYISSSHSSILLTALMFLKEYLSIYLKGSDRKEGGERERERRDNLLVHSPDGHQIATTGSSGWTKANSQKIQPGFLHRWQKLKYLEHPPLPS